MKDDPKWIFMTDLKLFRKGRPVPLDNTDISASTNGSPLSHCLDDNFNTNFYTRIIVYRENENTVRCISDDPNPWLRIDTKDEKVDKIIIYNWRERHNAMGLWLVGMRIDVYETGELEMSEIPYYSGVIDKPNLLYEFDLTRQKNLLLEQWKQEPRRIAVVTGGAGFVGRHFVSRLCDEGSWIVIVVDDLSAKGSLSPSHWPKHLQRCTIAHESKILDEPTEGNELIFIQQDCRLFFQRQDFGIHFQVHLFIHLASIVGGRAKIENEPFTIADDLNIDTAAFQWAMRIRPEHMIYFSSSAAYPIAFQENSELLNIHNEKQHPVLLDESMIDFSGKNRIGKDFGVPDLTYGWSKLTGEYLAHQLQKQYGVKVSIYRPFSGYGEDQDDSYPFPSILKRIIAASKTKAREELVAPIDIELWSNATRDFVYIEDIVSCVLFSYASLSSSEHGAMNLASGSGTSFETLAQIMASMMRLDYSNSSNSNAINIRFATDRPRGVDYRVGSNQIAESFGCSFPTSIQKGIAIAAAYLKNAIANDTKLPPESTIESSEVEDSKIEPGFDKQRTIPLHEVFPKYSSHHCIGTSQGLFNMSLQHSADQFPLASNADFRVCHLKNMCFSEGKLLYYRDPNLATVSSDFFPPAMNTSHSGSMFYTGIIDFSIIPIHLIDVEMITNQSYPSKSKRRVRNKIAAFGATALSFNYGHYILDDVVPIFSAARIFNLPFDQIVQLLHHECDTLQDVLLYGIGPLTMRQACMERFNTMWPYFFNNAPKFLPRENTICFDNIIAGHNIALGLRSLQLTRAVELREFRDFVLTRNKKRVSGRWDIKRSDSTVDVMVFGKGDGWWSSEINVCSLVTMYLSFDEKTKRFCDHSTIDSCSKNDTAKSTREQLLRIHRFRPFRIECKNVDDLKFEDEVTFARQAHIMVSLHGTTAYTSLFAQSGTQQIMISTKQDHPRSEAKENHVLMWSTHAKARYIPYNYLDELQGALLLAATEVLQG